MHTDRQVMHTDRNAHRQVMHTEKKGMHTDRNAHRQTGDAHIQTCMHTDR